MKRFAANLSLLFTELPLTERFAAARDAGFGAVEIQFPYDHAANELAAAARKAGLPVILINAPAGDLMAGGDGLACRPDRQHDFAEALQQAVTYARTLKSPLVNVLPGRLRAGLDRQSACNTLATNLALAAKTLAPHGIRVCCEAINDLDMPRFLIRTADELAAVLDHCPDKTVGMQIDLYHMARMTQDIPALLAHHLPRIAHIQFADHPGRHAPGSGQLPLAQLFAQLRAGGYPGWLAAEYRPDGHTGDSLDWLQTLA